MDYRRMFDDKDLLYAYDLEDAKGRDVVLQIEKVYPGELTGEKGRKSKKPFVKFVGKEKKLALNKTNGKSIAKMYGKDADAWPGKWVALYTAQVEYDGEMRDCIRIRPKQPAAKQNAGKRPGPVPTTQGELEQALKEQGLIDETHQDRVNAADPDAAEQAEIAAQEAQQP